MSEAQAAARRTAFVLAAAQAIVGSAASICISVGGLAGHYLLDLDKSLATAPVTGYNIGVAIGALPAAAILRSLGQRPGFMSGAVITMLGGAVATSALFAGNFWLFAIGLLVVGLGGAFVQQFRFAAADNAPAEFKPRAISFVLAGGVATAIIGPQIIIYTSDLFPTVMFAGSFAAIIILGLLGIGILSLLPRRAPGVVAASAGQGEARPLGEIMRQPQFVAGLTCAVGSYALMSFVMTGAPLAMVGCGFTTRDAALGISWHVMAMFGPSFFTGRLIQRFGATTIVATGLALLAFCSAVALTGIELWQFWTSLILLGLGWNFGFIGATAMTAQTYRPSERARVLGIHDFILFGSVAFGSLMSGNVYNHYGWDMLNWIVFPVVVLCFVTLGLTALRGRLAEA